MKKPFAALIIGLLCFAMLAGFASVFNCGLVKAGTVTSSPSQTSLKQLWNTTSLGVNGGFLFNGRLYTGSDNHGGINNVLCLDAVRGTVIWTAQTGATGFANVFALANGYVYVLVESGEKENVLCLDAATGAKIWSSSPTTPYSYSNRGVENGYVYLYNFYADTYYCLNAATGANIWNFTQTDLGWSMGGYFPVFANGYAYIIGNTGSLYCFSASGTNLWNTASTPFIWKSPVVGIPVASGNYLYVGSYDSNLYCLNAATGAIIWNQTGIAKLGSVAVANGFVYSMNSGVYCLNAATGAIIWSQYIFVNGVTLGHLFVFDNGYVYLVGNALYCFDASNGNLKWGFQANDQNDFVYIPQAYRSYLYMSTTEGIICAFEPLSNVQVTSSSSTSFPSPTVPEFPSWLVLPALLFITSMVAVAAKRKLGRR